MAGAAYSRRCRDAYSIRPPAQHVPYPTGSPALGLVSLDGILPLGAWGRASSLTEILRVLPQIWDLSIRILRPEGRYGMGLLPCIYRRTFRG